MRRRKYIIGAGSIVTGTAAALGTGATDAYTTNRDATTEVATSSDLKIEPNTTSDFVQSSSTMSVTFDDLENDAYAEARPAFTVANNTDETLYVEMDNPFADSDLSDGGVDLQFIAVNNPDQATAPVLFDRTTPVDGSVVESKKDFVNPYRLQQSAGSGILRNIKGASGPGYSGGDPQHIELGSGQTFEVIARAIALDAENVDTGGTVTVEAFDDPAATNLPGPSTRVP